MRQPRDGETPAQRIMRLGRKPGLVPPRRCWFQHATLAESEACDGHGAHLWDQTASTSASGEPIEITTSQAEARAANPA